MDFHIHVHFPHPLHVICDTVAPAVLAQIQTKIHTMSEEIAKDAQQIQAAIEELAAFKIRSEAADKSLLESLAGIQGDLDELKKDKGLSPRALELLGSITAAVKSSVETREQIAVAVKTVDEENPAVESTDAP